jgi:hypothetical protein
MNGHKSLQSLGEYLRVGTEALLKESGIENMGVASITLYLKRGPHHCPDNTEPVWETVVRPDGTIVSEWVCK